jgi:hypothetical protein
MDSRHSHLLIAIIACAVSELKKIRDALHS